VDAAVIGNVLRWLGGSGGAQDTSVGLYTHEKVEQGEALGLVR